MANGVKITAGWSDAYEVDFTAGGGGGDRPIVLSYASSPPFTIPKGGDEADHRARCWTPASARWSTPACWPARDNPKGAAGVHRLHGQRRRSRRRCPTTCTSSPSTRTATLPADWARCAPGRARSRSTVARGRDRRAPRRPGCGSGATSPAGDDADRVTPAGTGWGSSRWRRCPLAVARGVLRAARSPGMVGPGLLRPTATSTSAGSLEVLGRPRVHRVLVVHGLVGGAATVRHGAARACRSAFVLHRLRFPGRGLLRAFVLMPFVLPTVVVGVAFRTLLAPSGPLGGLGLDGTPVAIVAAMVFFNVAVVVRTVGALWEGLDPRREEAAAALGASPLQVLRTVTLPALLPGDRLGGQRGVPVLRDGVRRRAHAGRAALRHRRDRDLPAHHPVPRPAGARPRCRCSSSSWSACCCTAPSGPGPGASTPLDRTGERDATRRPRRAGPAGARGDRARRSASSRPRCSRCCSARCGSATPGGWRTTATSRRTGQGERAAGAGVHGAGELLAGRGRRHPARDAARRAGRRWSSRDAGRARAGRRGAGRCSTRSSCCRSGSPR